MPCRLSPEEIVTVHVLRSKGQSNCAIARTLGVSEGTVRYHAKRRADGAVDGRSGKPFKGEAVAGLIKEWIDEHERLRAQGDEDRPVNVRDLFDFLVTQHDYRGSYRSVLRFVRRRYPAPRLRTYRRVETPPGAQAQVDWGEFSGIDIGDGPQTLYAFVMVLSHSRKPAVVWSRRTDQLAWHHVHNEALRRLGGVPAVLRIDNLKTGVARGAGPWGEINKAYASYARALRFHVDACLPRAAWHKGKVEKRVGILRRLDVRRRRFSSLEELQAWTDLEIERACQRLLCPATGLSVAESYRHELPLLQPLAALPEPFDVVVNRPVHRDATVHFEARVYSVPFTLVGLHVEVRGSAESVQILYDGRIVAEHRRHSRERLILLPDHYEGPGDDRVEAPTPLGRLGRRMQEIVEQPVEQRPLDLYAALAEVLR